MLSPWESATHRAQREAPAPRSPHPVFPTPSCQPGGPSQGPLRGGVLLGAPSGPHPTILLLGVSVGATLPVGLSVVSPSLADTEILSHRPAPQGRGLTLQASGLSHKVALPGPVLWAPEEVGS